MTRGLDDCIGIAQARINFLCRCYRPLPFDGILEKFFRELHCPGNLRAPPVELAVNEICAPAKEQSDRCSRDQCVAQIGPPKLVAVRVVKAQRENPNHAAVTGHPTLPHPYYRERFAEHFWSVKKDVTNSTADQHTKERSPRYEITHPFPWQVAVTDLGEPAHHQIRRNKGEDVCQSVPARPDVIPKPKNKWIEIVDEIRQHRREYSLPLLTKSRGANCSSSRACPHIRNRHRHCS